MTASSDGEKRPFDPKSVRQDFPMLQQSMNGKPFVYFDTAVTAQKPQCVIDAITKFYSEEYSTVHRAVYGLAAKATEKYSAVRDKVATFIGAESEEEIVFTRGTTESINLIARTLGEEIVGEGDEVIITEFEHHSNIVPWQMLCEKKRAHLKVAKGNSEGDIDLDHYASLFSERTKIASFAHVFNALGTINPVKEMIAIAKKHGVITVVDGAQSAPHIPLNVADMGTDFFAFSGHKVYGPTGVGILYGKKEHLRAMPPFHGGGDMIEEVTLQKTVFQEPPLKFEAGTPIIAPVIGLGAALDYLSSFDRAKVLRYENNLLTYALDQLASLPNLQIVGSPKKRASLITFKIDGVHPLDLGTLLGLKGIAIRTGTMCAGPAMHHFGLQTACRLSFGIYNTKEEVDVCVEALNETASLLTTI